jgi:hypothetical protein
MSHPRDPTDKPDDTGLGILDNAEPGPSKLRWKPVPAIILAAAIVYTITIVVGSITVVVININDNALARACIEAGGQWLISEQGDRECRRGDNNG